MEQETMARAISITEHTIVLKKELRKWIENTDEGIVSPLSFRIGGDINYMDKEAFEQFKAISIACLEEKISELEAEFAAL